MPIRPVYITIAMMQYKTESRPWDDDLKCFVWTFYIYSNIRVGWQDVLLEKTTLDPKGYKLLSLILSLSDLCCLLLIILKSPTTLFFVSCPGRTACHLSNIILSFSPALILLNENSLPNKYALASFIIYCMRD